MFAALQALDLLRPEKRVLHVAAELPLFRRFKEIYGENYTIGNLSMDAMSRFNGVNKITFDMCGPEPVQRRFDVVIHSHVLEHVYCNWALALMRINNLLADGGTHLFCVPVRNEGHYKEDLDPNLPVSVRIEEFGKNDHVRTFIKGSFHKEMRELCRLTGFDVRLATGIVGEEAKKRIAGTGHVFVVQRIAGQSGPS